MLKLTLRWINALQVFFLLFAIDNVNKCKLIVKCYFYLHSVMSYIMVSKGDTWEVFLSVDLRIRRKVSICSRCYLISVETIEICDFSFLRTGSFPGTFWGKSLQVTLFILLALWQVKLWWNVLFTLHFSDACAVLPLVPRNLIHAVKW